MCLIAGLFVRRDPQEQRIGSERIKRALESVKKKNVKEVHVTTREGNHEAMKFYQKHGFNKAGVLSRSNSC